MAENKKSFVLYADIIHTVKKLPDEKAGVLLKTILSYVNDENPSVDDFVVDLVFEPIKQQLKRDLIAWRSEQKKRSDSGKLGGIKSGESRRKKRNEAKGSTPSKNEAKGSNPSKNEANEGDNVNVTVNVTDSVSKDSNNLKVPTETNNLKVAELQKTAAKKFNEKGDMTEDAIFFQSSRFATKYHNQPDRDIGATLEIYYKKLQPHEKEFIQQKNSYYGKNGTISPYSKSQGTELLFERLERSNEKTSSDSKKNN